MEEKQDVYYVQETYTYTEYGRFPKWERWTEMVGTRRGFFTGNAFLMLFDSSAPLHFIISFLFIFICCLGLPLFVLKAPFD